MNAVCCPDSLIQEYKWFGECLRKPSYLQLTNIGDLVSNYLIQYWDNRTDGRTWTYGHQMTLLEKDLMLMWLQISSEGRYSETDKSGSSLGTSEDAAGTFSTALNRLIGFDFR